MNGKQKNKIGEKEGVSYAYENTGTSSSPAWTAKPSWDAPDVGFEPRPAFADLDGDGYYDLLIGEMGDVSHAYENTAPPAEPYVFSSNATGTEKNVFDLNEDVYCYAGNLTPDDPAVDIYVVPNKAWSVGESIGSDVSGGVGTVSTDGSGNIGDTLIWSASLTAGNYDIIVDLDQDGVLDAGEPVDDVTFGEGFEAIPEFSTIAIPVAAILWLLFLFSQRRKKEE